ncbi:hypothetical protein [Vibrio phage phiKT1028]|nr:hypothetical protein [Vibrio phage phiKT1028]
MKKFMTLIMACMVTMLAYADYVSLDDSSTHKWEYNPTSEPYTFIFNYQVNDNVSMNLVCKPLSESAEFILMVNGENRPVKAIYGYDAQHDLAQHVEMNLEGFVYSDFAHLFAQYETIWFLDELGREIVTFDNKSRMSANELFSFRKQCRLVVLN